MDIQSQTSLDFSCLHTQIHTPAGCAGIWRCFLEPETQTPQNWKAKWGQAQYGHNSLAEALVCVCYCHIPAALKCPWGSSIYIFYSPTGTFLIDFNHDPLWAIRNEMTWWVTGETVQVEDVKLLPYRQWHPACDWRYKLSKLTGRLHRWFRCCHRNPHPQLNCKKNKCLYYNHSFTSVEIFHFVSSRPV